MRTIPDYKTQAKTEAQTAAREAWTNKIKRQHDALVKRQVERDARTPAQQLKVLDARLGKGIGAKKERARLVKQIEDRKGNNKGSSNG